MKHFSMQVAVAVSLIAPSAAISESISATIVAGHPPVFRWVKMFDEAFVPAVQAGLNGTGYEMAFTGQYGGAIAGVGEELETIESGLAELGTCQSLFDPAKMAVQNVTYYTPFVSDDPRKVGELMHTLQVNDPKMQRSYDENGVVYVGAPVVIDDYLLMTSFPVTSLGDLDGKKIGAPGPALNWLSGTGAVGVSGNLTTYYNELKTGVFDGVIVFASAALPGKLYEVAPHVTRAGLGAQYAGSICANADWYNALPEAVQSILHDAADATGEWYVSALEAAVETSFQVMAKNGATITDASDDMRNAWASGMENAAKTWAAGLDDQGVPGSEVLSEYMEQMRKNGATPLRDWDSE